jgi:formylglycine-generating enzyme required for sulfatase activity
MSGGCRVWTGKQWQLDPNADWCSPGFQQTDRHPVVGVSWQDANAYVEWLGRDTGQPYRLPSEAEWEYCCRAGTTTRYSWGDAAPTPQLANFGRNIGSTTEIGSYPFSPWGLHDMHGNVLEWVEDCWNDSYLGAPADGAAWLAGKRSLRVVRGGSWHDGPRNLRAADRGWDGPDYRRFFLGFRVVRTLTP